MMRPWLANIVGVGVAALVMGGGLVLSAPEAAANGPSRAQTIGAVPTVGDSAGEIPLGDTIQVFGRPSRLGIFWTSDPSDKIAQTYVAAWSALGFHLPPRTVVVDKVTSVTALDASDGPGAGLLRSVTIIDEGNDRMVLPNVSDMRQPLDISPRSAPLPVPENASAYMGETTDDAGAVSYSGSYLVPIGAQRVMDFYEQELGKDGYKIQTPRKKVEGGAMIEFERGQEWISIVARDADSKKLAKDKNTPKLVSEVMLTHVRSIEQKPEWKP